MADDTIVVFTSDHGDLLGAHGGLIQKWCNAFDEATRVPLLVRRSRDRAPERGGVNAPTSHVDLIPTLLGSGRHRRRAGRRRGRRCTTTRPTRCRAVT